MVYAYSEQMVKIDESDQYVCEMTKDKTKTNCLAFTDESRTEDVLLLRNIPNNLVQSILEQLLEEDFFDLDTLQLVEEGDDKADFYYENGIGFYQLCV